MKLFVSYGHDDHQAFVRRIKADLESLGHACWIDSEQIHKQPDWRRSLMDALHDCDWTVGFLSRHSMRPGSVTPQELAIANDLKAGCLTTVLLEPQTGWQVPVAIGHAQWVDMSDYAARQHDPAWYAAKLAELRDRLDPALAERYRDEITRLEDWLDPVPQQADIAAHLNGFVGREWLADILEDWRLGRTDARLFWLTGKPGTGKSAFSAWITATHRGNVVGLNLCRWDLRDRCDAARVVRTLAWFIARRVQDYRVPLLRLMRNLDRAALDSLDAPKLFDRLLAQPLTHCFDGGRSSDRLLLVIDGLDEAVANQGADALHGLMDLLRRQGPLLPPWVGLLVSSRPEQPAATAFDGVPMLRIDANTADNRADLRLYAQGWLGATNRSKPEIDALIDAIDARADGSFIYLRKLCEAHENRGLPLDKDALPHGLNGLYDEWFRRQFPDPKPYRERIAPLLALIAAAETPVPEAILDEAMAETVADWDEIASAEILQSLGSLFERHGDDWTPFHKSLRDWLTDRTSTPVRHLVPVARGHDRLAALLWRHFTTAATDPGVSLSPFLLRELPAQAARQTSATRIAWINQASNWDALDIRFTTTIALLRRRRSWPDTLAWCDLSDQLGTAAQERGQSLIGWVANQRGDVLNLLGRTMDALDAYRAGMAIAERLAALDRDNANWQNDLSISHTKIGDVLQSQGNLNGALDAFRASMAIAERLAASDGDNADWQRDLSISHARIGDVLQRQDNLNGALEAYRASMAIAERLAASDRDNTDWQRDLSISHDRIGDVLQIQGNLNGALEAFRAGMAITERLAASDRNNVDWQRDLSISYSNLGDMLKNQGNKNGALEAYRASMAIIERLAALDRDNANWQRDLSISYSNLGDMLKSQGKLNGALEAYRASMAIIERLAALDRDNANWQRGLSISYSNLGDMLKSQNNLDSALEAYRAGMAITERLAASDRNNVRWQHDLSISHDNIGNVLRRQGNLDGEFEAYRASMAITERLAASDRNNVDWQRDLSISYRNLGDMLLQDQSNLNGALEAYRASMAITERLIALDDDNVHLQRDLSTSYSSLGDMLQSQNDLNGALEAYRASLAITKRLAASDRNNINWQRDLFNSHDSIADILQRQDNLNNALEAYRASIAIRARLAASDRNNVDWQHGLSISHDQIGDVLQSHGNLDGALEAYRASMAITERLAASDRNKTYWQHDLSISHNKVGDVLRRQGNLKGAVDAYRASMAIRACFAVSDGDNAAWQRDLFVSLFNITELLLEIGDREEACSIARRLDTQAMLLAERFPQDPERDSYLSAAADLLARACGPAT